MDSRHYTLFKTHVWLSIWLSLSALLIFIKPRLFWYIHALMCEIVENNTNISREIVENKTQGNKVKHKVTR